jgi:hypothetical protein
VKIINITFNSHLSILYVVVILPVGVHLETIAAAWGEYCPRLEMFSLSLGDLPLSYQQSRQSSSYRTLLTPCRWLDPWSH